MNLDRILYTIVAILLSCQAVLSEVSAPHTIRQLSNTDGLSNNSVNCIFEDTQQNIWIGTWDGLNVYNGRDFKTFRYSRSNENSITNNVVRQIIESDINHIWVATDYGVNRWNKQTQDFTRFFLGTEHQIPKQEKSYLIATSSQNIVICYVKQQGLFFFNEAKQTFEKIDFSLENGVVKNFVVDSHDNIYLLYDNGILQKAKLLNTNGRINVAQPGYVERDKAVTDICYTSDILILNYGSYLRLIDDRNQYPTAIDVDKNKTVSQVLYDKGKLLIAYNEGGGDAYNLHTRIFEPIDSDLVRTSILTLFIGSQNILWVGTDGQGVYMIYTHSSPFKTVFTNHPVRAFCQYNSNQIILGTKGDGLKMLDKSTQVLSDFRNVSNGLISNSVYTIKRNRVGDLFIGTEGEGINILTAEGQLQRLQMSGKYPAFKAVYSICFTNSDSVLWLGTSGYGLIKIELEKEGNAYRAKKIEQYRSANTPKSLNNDVIYSIVPQNDGRELWLGTRGGGVSRFNIDKKTFDRLDDINQNLALTNNDVLSLTTGSDGLWIGTSYGLNRYSFSSQTIKEYTELEGLANNTIHGILEDQHRNIWVSTNLGLSFIDLKSNLIVNYSSKDGLQNDEFSDGAYYKDNEQTLYFGGVNGFNYFSPDQIHLRDFSPLIDLSNLRIYNTSQNIFERIKNNTLKLAYDEAYVTFSFIARDFINNQNCEYNYRLLNFSDEWMSNGNNPNIVFTKLPPGKYVLEVKVTNGDRVWGSNIYTLKIDVAYPWWQSWFAYLMYILIVGVIGYVIYSVIKNRIRLNRQLLLEHIEKQNQQKMHESKLNFFTNVAHEFFTPLTLIYGPAQHLLEKADLDSYTKRYIQIVKNNADRMQKLISELMEFRKVESGHVPLHAETIDVGQLIEYITDNYTEIAEENRISFDVDVSSDVSSIVTDRNSLEKILFNLISNAFKYTPSGGYINIIVSRKLNNLQFSIKNSGRGLTEKQMSEIFNRFQILETTKLQNATSTGVGLGLTKSLTEMLGGKIDVSSKLGSYVLFELSIPPMESQSAESDSNEIETEALGLDPHIYEKKDISILIVEDEKNIRELLKDILSPYYNVNEAEDGADAVAKIEQNMPDIIISDILMPNLDGIGLIDTLKSNAKTAHIPIINISAKNAVEDHISAYQHGADLYITKPFHPRHVLTTVQNLVNRRSILKDYFKSSMSAITVKDGKEVHQDDERLIQEIVSFIEKNMDDESLNPNSIAEVLGLSKATLYRKLKELTDKTPSEFVRTIRLNYASQLLVTTKLTVQEVMFKSGFTNKSYFYREFAKQYNMSPKEYREAN